MDLDDLEHNTRDGVHIASLAGTWIALVGGFGGMRDQDGTVSFAPRLPEELTRLAFTISHPTAASGRRGAGREPPLHPARRRADGDPAPRPGGEPRRRHAADPGDSGSARPGRGRASRQGGSRSPGGSASNLAEPRPVVIDDLDLSEGYPAQDMLRRVGQLG